MNVVVGTGAELLGAKVLENLGQKSLEAKIDRFPDGESRVEITGKLETDKRVFVIQSTNKDDHIIELLLIIDALKRLGVRDIVPVVPYFGYARSDRIVQYGAPIAAKVIADLINKSISALVVMDVHFEQFEGYFNVPVYNLSPNIAFAEYIKSNSLDKNAVVVAPDFGCAKKAKAFADTLSLDVVVLRKHRASVGNSEVLDVFGDPKEKNCIILDDIISGGGTLCGAAEMLKKLGAKSAFCFVTHGVFTENAITRLENSQIDELVITDSIKSDAGCSKIKIASIADIIVQKMKSIN